jgi:hypothetical protein
MYLKDNSKDIVRTYAIIAATCSLDCFEIVYETRRCDNDYNVIDVSESGTVTIYGSSLMRISTPGDVDLESFCNMIRFYEPSEKKGEIRVYSLRFRST